VYPYYKVIGNCIGMFLAHFIDNVMILKDLLCIVWFCIFVLPTMYKLIRIESSHSHVSVGQVFFKLWRKPSNFLEQIGKLFRDQNMIYRYALLEI